MSKRVMPKCLPQQELEEVRETDPDGRIVVRHRTVDTLGKMLRAGTIDEGMHDAAKDFQACFTVAQLDTLRAISILRVPGTGREPNLNERQLDARRRVHAAMHALGGISSPAGSCVWHVVGLQRSVRGGRSAKAGAGGRCGRSRRGILVAALGMLAAHFGYGEASGPHEGMLVRPCTTASGSESRNRQWPRRPPLMTLRNEVTWRVRGLKRRRPCPRERAKS